jgi:hypothetical protein
MLGVPGLTRIIKAATLELGPKGPWKVRPAAIKSEVLRIVNSQFRASCDNLMSFAVRMPQPVISTTGLQTTVIAVD